MTQPNIYANAVRRPDGWHFTIWFDGDTMPEQDVVLVLKSLGDLEAAAVAKYEQDNKQ